MDRSLCVEGLPGASSALSSVVRTCSEGSRPFGLKSHTAAVKGKCTPGILGSQKESSSHSTLQLNRESRKMEGTFDQCRKRVDARRENKKLEWSEKMKSVYKHVLQTPIQSFWKQL